MPAYADADGKVVVFFQNAGKFSYRYSTLGFQDAANLDDGDVWPVSYALKKWSPMVEKKVAELVKAAISLTGAATVAGAGSAPVRDVSAGQDGSAEPCWRFLCSTFSPCRALRSSSGTGSRSTWMRPAWSTASGSS